jgi:pSer/pThr/pTyr-binding forkhead associated (FHA) protein
MPRLTLQCEDRVLKQYAVGPVATIGRLGDNTIIIDSPAVSSHHACIFRDGYRFTVEDLQSTNGTFVNGTRVSRQILQNGDVVRVGRHELVLDQMLDAVPEENDEAGELAAPSEGETVFIDRRKLLARLVQSKTSARKCDALLARLQDIETQSNRSREAMPERTAMPAALGVLRVLEGRTDKPEYALESHTSLIGSGKTSLIRLRGWFKPRVAVVITRNRTGYVATWLGGEVLINSQQVGGRHELKHGDLVTVSGLVLEFCLES